MTATRSLAGSDYLDNGIKLLRVVDIYSGPPAKLLVEDARFPEMPLMWRSCRELGEEGFKPTRRKARKKRTKTGPDT